jgi:glucosamine--fructose-6-phosphate aminotransferase (isomerizing)
MTELMKDILKQPDELIRTLTFTLGPGRAALEKAANILNDAQHIYLTGIGSSWSAGFAISSLFHADGRPALLVDASELLHFVQLPRNSAVIVLSRSGRSVEVVNLRSKLERSGARTVVITNTPDNPLSQVADVVLRLEAAFDHTVSVTMYSGMLLVGGLLASASLGNLSDSLTKGLVELLSLARNEMGSWLREMNGSTWFSRDPSTYFLARGGSLASCHEAKLLWEEAAKVPASAMTTGCFRHGSQEIIVEGLRFGIWIDSDQSREQDLVLTADIRKFGGKVMLIGQNLSADAGDLVLRLPITPRGWQFLVDIMPAQLAAEHLSQVRGMDCDSFRICSYIVESDRGLTG